MTVPSHYAYLYVYCGTDMLILLRYKIFEVYQVVKKLK